MDEKRISENLIQGYKEMDVVIKFILSWFCEFPTDGVHIGSDLDFLLSQEATIPN